MHASYLLAFAAVAMGCTNPDSNSCASFIKSQAATASPFCASFTRTTYTASTGLPSWASNCSNKPKEISKECSCHWAGAAPTTFTTTQGSGPTATTTNPGPTTSAGNGGGGGGSCGSSGVSQLVGYAAGVTGGGSGSGTTVTSCSALQSAVSAGGVIRINGFLSGCGIIDLESNTSILGVGSGSGLTGGGFRIKDASNVIIRNLRFSVAVSKGDLLALDGATRVWIDHNDFSSRGLTGGKDDYDGLLDITHASDQVTVSWNKFHDHVSIPLTLMSHHVHIS
jgi:pectate lyase